ncbi:MAG: LolA family protein [Acidimicrobiales bacterium]
MSEYRDEELGAALATLEVPPHRPGFWDELEQRLMPERVERHRERQWDGLATDTSQIRRGSVAGSGGGRWLLAAAAVLLVVAATAGALALRRDGDGGQQVATVAEVADALSNRLATLRTLHGTVELTNFSDTGEPIEEDPVEFWRSSDGSYRLEYADGEVAAYDFRSGTMMTSMLTETRTPLGPPDGGAFGSHLLEQDVTTALQAARHNPAATVDEQELDGRPVWAVEIPLTPDLLGDGSPDRMELVIDRELRVPLRVTRFSGDRRVAELSFRDLAVDEPLPPDVFRVEQPGEVDPIDFGFERATTPDEAGAAVGYPAPVPATVPGGFRLVGVSWAGEAQPTGAEAANPPSVDVITLLYTRGFEWFTVSTRRAVAGGSETVWDDPIAGEGQVQAYETVVLADGRFDGVEAPVSLTQPFPPHLWALGEDLVLTVAGNLTADELVEVAESIP